MTSPVAWFEDDPQAACHLFKAALCEGHCAVMPTDTVYGLAAGICSQSGYREIYKLKGRDFQKPIAILAHPTHEVSSQVGAMIRDWPDKQEMYYAGQLTVVVDPDHASALPPETQCVQPGAVGIRVPSGAASQSLIAACGGVIWATSFNISGAEPCTNAKDAQDLLTAVTFLPAAAILSRESLPGNPSQVAILDSNGLTLLRQ